jgi:hypothetical protein
MDKKSFLLYFDLAFMVWVMLGPLGVQIAKDLGLTHAQKGMMVATPVLAGAILRIFMGVLVDHLKPKLAGRHRPGDRHRRPVLRLVLRHPQLRADADPRGSSSASPAPRSPSPCRSPRAGIRRSIRVRPWASPVPATRAPRWPP